MNFLEITYELVPFQEKDRFDLDGLRIDVADGSMLSRALTGGMLAGIHMGANEIAVESPIVLKLGDNQYAMNTQFFERVRNLEQRMKRIEERHLEARDYNWQALEEVGKREREIDAKLPIPEENHDEWAREINVRLTNQD